jgi:cytochrome-b5 reductase
MALSGGMLISNIIYFKYFYRPSVFKLSTDEFHPFQVSEIIPLTSTTSLFRFEAFVPEAHYGNLPIPSHVIVKDDTCEIAREYTPITYTKTGFDLLVRKYENGCISKLIHSLNVGDSASIRGPIWSFPYSENMADEIGMIAGGTGITPMYQLIKHILKTTNDTTKIKLVYANKSEDEILLRNELQVLEMSHPDRLHVHYVLDKASDKEWKGSVGYVNDSILKKELPDPQNPRSLVLVCGPDGYVFINFR